MQNGGALHLPAADRGDRRAIMLRSSERRV